MSITLTTQEALIVRADFAARGLSVLIVEGDRLWDGPNRYGVPPSFVAPSRWADLDKPCDICGGDPAAITLDSVAWHDRCAYCPDGRQVWELRTECPHIVGWNDLTAIIDGTERVLVARATVQVVPVVDQFVGNPRPALRPLPHGLALINFVEGEPPDMVYVDPLPVPGRDFGVVLREVK